MPRLDDEGFAAAFFRDLAQGRDLPASAAAHGASSDLSSADWAERVAADAEQKGLLPRDLGARTAARLLKVFRRNLAAVTDHHPEPYPGDVVLVRARTPLYEAGAADRTLGWGTLLTRLQTVDLEGDHYSLVLSDAGVAAVAQVLRERLARHLDGSEPASHGAPLSARARAE
jgi:thioesterase domain-containing protein